MQKNNHLNISTVDYGYSLEATPDLVPEIYTRQSNDTGTLNGTIITEEGMNLLIEEINYLIEKGYLKAKKINT